VCEKKIVRREEKQILSEDGMGIELGESKVISKGSFGKQLWERGGAG
jgi:hypothetical protein